MSTRVLIFDDGSASVDLVSMLPPGFPCRVAPDRDELQQQLDAFAPDVCILNFSCASTSLDDVAALRGESRWNNVPIVGVGNRTDDNLRVDAFRAGIDDFLDDLSSPEELTWKIRRWAQFYRCNELGATVSELLTVFQDSELSPFGPLVHSADLLGKVPAFSEHEALSMWLNGTHVLAHDMISRIDLLREYLACRQGDTTFAPVPFTLGAALLPQLDIWREHADVPDLAIDVDDDVLELEINADFTSVKRILRWVGINACEHAYQRVSVTAAGGHGRVQITITDDGDGFAPEEREQAFAGFHLGNRLNLSHQMGLHLSLAREMLHHQDGIIEIANPGPRDTTIRIILPAAHVEE